MLLKNKANRMFLIRYKLLLGFGIILLLTMAGGLGILSMLERVNTSYNQLIESEVKIMNQTQATLIKFEQAALDLRGYMLTGDPNYILRYQEEMQSVQGVINELNQSITVPEGKNYVNTLVKAFQAFQVYADQAVALKQQTIQMSDKLSGYQQIEDFLNRGKGSIEGVVQAGNAIVFFMDDQLAKGKQRNNIIFLEIQKYVVIGIISLLLVSLLAAIIIIKSISQPIKDLTKQVSRVAEGDLSSEKVWVKSTDEFMVLAKAFNKMTEFLRGILLELKDKSNLVASNAQQLASTIQQASSIAATSAVAMQQIASTIQQVTGNTRNVSRMAETTSQQAKEGQAAIDNIHYQMNQITASTKEVGQAIGKLNSTSQQVFQIDDLITEIAEQTNLLALNAAIEAARAGDHGKGFAVVAEEVGKLAERSATAAGEIKVLIATVQEESTRAVGAAGAGEKEVASGSQVALQVGSVLHSIIQSVEVVESQIREVAAASDQMSGGLSNVVDTIQEQNSIMEEIASMAEGFSTMAAELEQMSTTFRLSEEPTIQ